MRLSSICLIVPALMMAVSGAMGETVAWWRFEVPRGSYLDTLVTEANSPLLDSTLGLNGVFITPEVPGRYVADGEGGKKYENTLSLLENSSESNLLKNDGATAFLNGFFVDNKKSWTWETFTYLRPSYAVVPYGMLMGNGTKEAHGIQFDVGADGRHLRFLSKGGVVLEGPPLEPEHWHHLAVVATRRDEGWDVAMYVDYEQVTSKEGVELDTADGEYGIASPTNPFDGYVDEMRLSDRALEPKNMLHASAD